MEIKDGSKFCTYCGSLQTEDMSDNEDEGGNGHRTTLSVLCIIALCIFMGLGGLVVYSQMPQTRYSRMLSLGNKYLDELDYEQAEASFAKAIDIAPKKADAYVGLSKAYVGQDKYPEALAAIKKGAVKAEDQDLIDEYIESCDWLIVSSDGSYSLSDDASGAGEETAAAITKAAPATEETKSDKWDEIQNEMNGLDAADVEFVSSDVSQYPLVKLYYRIENPDGSPITGLPQDCIAVKEKVSGGEYLERAVKGFEKLEGNERISIDLVGDKSGSMSEVMPKVQAVMNDFVNSLDYKAGDQVEIISFDTYVMYMCTYTSDANLLLNGISNIVADGGTSLYDALEDAVNSAAVQNGARCVIAFTDGNDNNSMSSPDEVISLAQQLSVPVYIIGAGDIYVDPLQNIASSTGGKYWNIDELYDMSDILQSIYTTQKDMYCVSYVSDSAIPQYDTRDISFEFADKQGTQFSGQADASVTPVKTAADKHSSRYEVIKKDISWEDANRECIAKGGHLVTITSQDEMNKVSTLAESSGIDYLWIGGYTSIRDGTDTFGHWVTGEDFNSYTAWYPGEPSRNDMDGAPEMYIMMWKMKGTWSWNDQRNDPVNDSGLDYFHDDTGYICEYEN